jgi:hypothetical protein
MLNRKKIIGWTGLLALAGFVCGCGAGKRMEGTEVPGKAMSNEEAPAPKASWKAAGHYLVQKHDCLWAIAGQARVYGDNFEWPLLFKANRDEIKDPDLIYPRQDLRVEKGYSLEEKHHAKQMAMATPKYVPHSKPRETLPVDYF